MTIGEESNSALARHRANAHLALLNADVRQTCRQGIDVDEVLRCRQSEFHHGRETVPASDEPCLRTKAVQQRNCMIDGGGTFVLERSWSLHETS